MFPLVAFGILVLLLSSKKETVAPPPEVVVPAAQKPVVKPKASPVGNVVVMAPGERWAILARALKPMTDDDWTNFASNLDAAMRGIGASFQDFKIGTGGSFAYAIVPNIVIKLAVPSTSADFRIEKAERLSAAPSV